MVPLKINHIVRRSQSRLAIDKDSSVLKHYRAIAFSTNVGYCIDDSNISSKVLGRHVKAGLQIYIESLEYKSMIIFFASKKLTKDQWASSSTVQIPFEIKGFERFKGVRVNEKLMKDLNLMFPALKKEILNYLRQTKIIVRDLVFVGHGLGGAYASIAGVKWAFESYLAKINNLWKGVDLSKIGQVVITFGAPRVGNRKFSELANESITHNRITFGNDPAQHFPLASEVWKHYGIETWIQPLKECDCIVDMNPLSHKYWNCNNNELEHLDRERWINGDYTEENMECSAGQSIEDVPGDFFHDGPYFGVKMGDCENLKGHILPQDALNNFLNRDNN